MKKHGGVFSRGAYARARGKGRQDEMNGTERAFAAWLDSRVTNGPTPDLGGEVVAWSFQPVKLRLADRTWYTADFGVQVLAPSGSEYLLVEVKGGVKGKDGRVTAFDPGGGLVKAKIARELHPFRLVIAVVRSIPKRDGGGVLIQIEDPTQDKE